MSLDAADLMERAAKWMIARGWRGKLAKTGRFEQSLFEHSLVELDVLLALLPMLSSPLHYGLTEAEQRILAVAVLVHDVGKETDAWQAYIASHGSTSWVSHILPELSQRVVPEVCTALGLPEFNGRVERIMGFSEAFQKRRCVVPADGFYEWTGPKGKRQPLWIHPRNGGLMLFAGLYECWYPERNQPEVTFTIVTCAANPAIAEIHDRMPVVLNERAAEDWMNPREQDPLSLKRLLVPVPSDLLSVRPASPLVNSVKNEGPALLDV
jgi:putative SOS response-associated peptidase YedK